MFSLAKKDDIFFLLINNIPHTFNGKEFNINDVGIYDYTIIDSIETRSLKKALDDLCICSMPINKLGDLKPLYTFEYCTTIFGYELVFSPNSFTKNAWVRNV